MSAKSLFSALLLAGLAATSHAEGCPAIRPHPTTTTTTTALKTSASTSVATSAAAATTVPAVPTTTPAAVTVPPTTLITVVRSTKKAATTSTTPAPAPVTTSTSSTSTKATTSTKAEAAATTVVATTADATTAAATTAAATTEVATTEAATTAAATTAATTTTAAAATTAAAEAVSTGASISGESTFYGGNVAGGACSFSTYTLPSSLFGTAFSGAVWDNAAECGRCVQVTGPSGSSIKAMIVDECPECAESHLDLFEDAFAELGAISAGILSTSYTFVPCGITTPLQLHSKSGTSAYWFSMQVVNANEGVTKLEVSTDGGSTWQATTRTTYNFFEQSSGFGADTVDVRVTSTSGSTVVVKDVSCASDAQTTATANF